MKIKQHTSNVDKVWMLFLLLFCIARVYLTYMQVYSTGDRFVSDITEHNIFAFSGSEYSLYGLILYPIGKFFSFSVMQIWSVIILSISDIFSIIIVKFILTKYIENRSICNFLSIALFFVSMLIVIGPLLYNSTYLGVGTPNIWHNPTFTLARPFSILVFYFTIKITSNIKEKKQLLVNDFILLSIFALLSCASKPSFLFVFVPAYAIYLLIYMIRNKFKNFISYLLIAVPFIPCLFVLYIQNSILFSDNNENQILFGYNTLWSDIAPYHSVLYAIVLACIFPLFVFIVDIKKHNAENILCFLMVLIGIFEIIFFSECGERSLHYNFFWGYYFALFFAFLYSSIQFFMVFKQRALIIKIIGIILFLAHLISGLYYFINLCLGDLYY